MRRIQFYPSTELANILNEEAQCKGVSVSTYVSDLLEDYYGMKKNGISITRLTVAVLKEVEKYIATLPPNVPFDLNKASKTFREIDMTCGKKPQTVRASIGRAFSAKLGNGAFSNVRKYQDKNGKNILSVNNALMYEIYQ